MEVQGPDQSDQNPAGLKPATGELKNAPAVALKHGFYSVGPTRQSVCSALRTPGLKNGKIPGSTRLGRHHPAPALSL